MVDQALHEPIRQLLGEYHPNSESRFHDPEGPLEVGLRTLARTPERLRASRDAIRALLDDVDASEEDLADFTVPWVSIPAGGSYRAWLIYVIARADAALAQPGVEIQNPDGIGPGGAATIRRSRFADRPTAELAVRDVLRAHEALLRAWAGDPRGAAVLHLYADLHRVVGTLRSLDLRGRPAAEPVEAQACVVLMARHARSGAPYIATSYPEVTLDVGVRERYPDLPLVFGGYFGQHLEQLYVNRWTAEYRLNTAMPDEVRSRLVEQLGQLLTLRDDELCPAIESLGSCTRPPRTRHWVEGLLRRMATLDWSPAQGH